MVAPIIAAAGVRGAAQVRKKAASTTARGTSKIRGRRSKISSTNPKQNKWVTRIANRKSATETESTLKEKTQKIALKAAAVAKAGSATMLIGSWFLMLYIPQAIFALLGYAGIGITEASFLSYFTSLLPDSVNPSLVFFEVTHLFAMILGIMVFIGSALTYAVRGVLDCFSGVRLLIFTITFALTIFFPVAPWIVIWGFAVVVLAE